MRSREEMEEEVSTQIKSNSDSNHTSPTSEVPLDLEIEYHKRSFLGVLRHVLSNGIELADIISWLPHGRSFTVHQPNLFGKIVCPVFFQGATFMEFFEILCNIGFSFNQNVARTGIIFCHKDFRRDICEEKDRGDGNNSNFNERRNIYNGILNGRGPPPREPSVQLQQSNRPVNQSHHQKKDQDNNEPHQYHVMSKPFGHGISENNFSHRHLPNIHESKKRVREYSSTLFDEILEREKEAEKEHRMIYSTAPMWSTKRKKESPHKGQQINGTRASQPQPRAPSPDANPLDLLAIASLSSKC